MGSVAAASPLGRVVPRRAGAAVDDALNDTRVVLVTGPRQAGKSTLVGLLTSGRRAEVRTLDATVQYEAARSDPAGFVDVPDLLVVDEIQRVPELLLAIKQRVDSDPRPGRFLLTGSARVLGLRAVPDALPGRTETVELWPFSQGEIDGTPDGFVDAVFARGPEFRHRTEETRAGYAERLVRGGFPEAVARVAPVRRTRFLDSYVDTLVGRDVAELSDITRPAEMRALLRLLAARSAQPLVANALANDLAVSARTVHRYLALLEEVFLVRRVPAWSRNVSARAVATPKLAFVDSGVAANLLGAEARSLWRPGGPVGPLLEGFVLMELARQLGWSTVRAELFGYRTRDGVEVDAVLEDRTGRVVGIEVKASSTVRGEDFRGLRHLAERLGDDFVVGIVLYTGTDSVRFGDRLRAVPVAALWEMSVE